MMANAEIVAARRDEIAARWLKGQSVASIAHELHIPLGTCKHHLALIRRAMVAGQPSVLRLARSRSMAVAELVSAQAWQRLDTLTTQDKPDEHSIIGYLGVVLKAEAHAARLAGLTQPDSQVQDKIVNADLRDEVARQDPDTRWRQAQDRQLAELMESVYSDVGAPGKQRPRTPRSPRRPAAATRQHGT
jgi:hypothetical protein